MEHRAIILFAHGSRDPLWRQPLDAVASRIRELSPDAKVACAFLELEEPGLLAAGAALVAGGARGITVVPMFLGAGKHVRDDLPVLLAQLRAAHPGLPVKLQPSVGENAAVIDLLAHMAVEE